jgi:hypothetical protein
MMIFQRNLTPLEYLYSALWMCCVWLSFLSTFYRKARCKKLEHYKLSQQPALRVLHRDKNYYYYYCYYRYSISQWFFGAVFITWLRHCHIDVRILGLVFFATDGDIGLLMGLEYSHGLPCK